MDTIPRYVYPNETELPIPNYLSDLELGINNETKGGKRKQTRKSKQLLDVSRKNAKTLTRKRKATRRLQKR